MEGRVEAPKRRIFGRFGPLFRAKKRVVRVYRASFALSSPPIYYTFPMLPAGYTCCAQIQPLVLLIQASTDGLWSMSLFDRSWGVRVVMPPSEFGLEAA